MISKKQIFELAVALDGIPVLGALAGSPAAKAGIQYGDVVLVVNGMRTRNVVDYVEAKALRTDAMNVVVFRNGAEHTFELVYKRPSQGASGPDAAAILAEVIGMRVVGKTDDLGPSPEVTSSETKPD